MSSVVLQPRAAAEVQLMRPPAPRLAKYATAEITKDAPYVLVVASSEHNWLYMSEALEESIENRAPSWRVLGCLQVSDIEGYLNATIRPRMVTTDWTARKGEVKLYEKEVRPLIVNPCRENNIPVFDYQPYVNAVTGLSLN
jgi:hypothetical protein